MPNRWAIQNGNWSNASTWSGSLIPTASDDVYTNNFTINVDTSFQVLTLRSTVSASAITAGGTYNFNTPGISGSVTAAVPILPNGNTQNITITASEGLVRLIFTSGSILTAGGGLIIYSGNCSLNLEGGVICTNVFASNGGTLITKTSPGNITITGSLLFTTAFGAGGGTTRILTDTGGAGTISIRGNIQGPSVAGSSNISVATGAGTSMIVNGNVTGGTLSAQQAISFGGSNLTINGNVTGGSLGDAISVTSTSNITVNGNIVAGGRAAAISSTGAHTFFYSGSLASSAGSPAIISTSATATNIFTGPFINNYNTIAVQCIRMFITSSAAPSWNYGNITLYSPSQIQVYPSSSNVRQGTIYAGGTLSGSLILPSSSLVISGVPTDNTTGSAVLLPSELQNNIWNRDLGQMTVTKSIGYRLVGVSTTDSMGKQISSYLV